MDQLKKTDRRQSDDIQDVILTNKEEADSNKELKFNTEGADGEYIINKHEFLEKEQCYANRR